MNSISREQYFLVFDAEFESNLKSIKSKNNELHVSRRGYDPFNFKDNFIILTRYLDDIAPSKITFSTIGFSSIEDNIYHTAVTELISKLVKIPNVQLNTVIFP